MTAIAPDRRVPFNLTEAFARLCETDLARRRSFVALAVAFIIVRLPFLNYGYGTDPDAWRVALTGQYLLETGAYYPSRLPGNPLHELIITPFVPLGWLATNFVTVLASLVGVYLFARIVRRLDLPTPGLLTIAFAFTPLLFINSISTMDYMWTLTAMLGAYYAALTGRPVLAGVCLGLAIGFRVPALIMTLPLAYLLWRQMDLVAIVRFGLAAVGVAALCFAPVLAVYGVKFWNYYDASVEYAVVLRLLGKEALGIGGSLAVLAGVAFSWRRWRSLPTDLRIDPQVGVWVLVIVAYFATFLRLPHEIAYLVPIFPFAYFLLGRYLKRGALVGAVAGILIAGIVDITTPGDGVSLDSVKNPSIGAGLLLSNRSTMISQREFVDDIMGADVPEHSVVATGFIYPQLAMRERGRLDIRVLQHDYEAISMVSDRGEAVDTARDVRYTWLLTYDTFLALRAQGYSFFIVPDAAGGTAALYDYRPTLFGATFLHLDRLAPSAGKGRASTDR